MFNTLKILKARFKMLNKLSKSFNEMENSDKWFFQNSTYNIISIHYYIIISY